MIFGSIDDFAIEAMTEPDLELPSAVWGRMQVWCQGIAIGDITNPYCALYPSYQGFGDLIDELPSLWRCEFDSLSNAQLLDRLDAMLFGYHGDVAVEDGRSLEQLAADWETYKKFGFLTHWGEQFDRCGRSFIVCTPAQRVRILNRSFLNAGLHTSAFQVASAAKDFRRWFAQEAARLGHPVTP